MENSATTRFGISRRNFMLYCGVMGTGLTAGLTTTATLGATDPTPHFSPFLTIPTSGPIRVIVPTAEMGQNVFTTLPACLVEELGADFDMIIVEHAPYDDRLAHPQSNSQTTGSSRSIRGWMDIYRKLGAGIRQNLVAEAAAQWNVDMGECEVEKGNVIHRPSGRKVGFGPIAASAAKRPLDQDPDLKPPLDWQILGKSLPRKDTADKATGKALFGVDVPTDEKLFAATRKPLSVGGKVRSFDATSAVKRPGVVGVYEVDNAVAVVAKDWWTAHRALRDVSIEYAENSHSDLDDEAIQAALKAKLDSDDFSVIEDFGNVESALASQEATVLTAEYSVPYLAHAAMEPMSALSQVNRKSVRVDMGNQNPTRVGQRTAEFLQVDATDVQVKNTFMGGSFGRRGLDFGALRQSLALSKKLGKPVHVIWDREEDTRHDLYRPASIARLQGAVDESGQLTAIKATMAGPSVIEQALGARLGSRVGTAAADGLRVPYAIANRLVQFGLVRSEVPIGFWRAVAHSDGPFMAESFIDELSYAADADPYQFRHKMLESDPRTRAVLERAALESGWSDPLPEGRARGIAVIGEAWGSYIAQVAEVSVESGAVKVHRVTAAVDCGVALDPATVEAQVRSAIVYGLSAALYGQINIREGSVVQSNFDAYPALRMADCPEIDVHIVNSGEPPGGVGEIGLAPVAPAVANAVFALSGVRARQLPLSELNFG